MVSRQEYKRIEKKIDDNTETDKEWYQYYLYLLEKGDKHLKNTGSDTWLELARDRICKMAGRTEYDMSVDEAFVFLHKKISEAKDRRWAVLDEKPISSYIFQLKRRANTKTERDIKLLFSLLPKEYKKQFQECNIDWNSLIKAANLWAEDLANYPDLIDASIIAKNAIREL